MAFQSVKPSVHLIITIVTITVIVQKQLIPAIAERSPSHVHLIVPVVQKTSKIIFFWRKIKINMRWTCTAVHLGKYDDRSRSLACAIAGIKPDPIPAIPIVTIVGIINSDVSIWSLWSLWSLTDFSAIVAIVTIKWTPGFIFKNLSGVSTLVDIIENQGRKTIPVALVCHVGVG